MALKFNFGLQNYYVQPGCYPVNRTGMGSYDHPLVGLNFAHRLLRLSTYTDNTHLLQELHAIVKMRTIDLPLRLTRWFWIFFPRHARTAGWPRHPNFQEQRLPGIVPFIIAILFREQNYNERGNALLRSIAAVDLGR